MSHVAWRQSEFRALCRRMVDVCFAQLAYQLEVLPLYALYTGQGPATRLGRGLGQAPPFHEEELKAWTLV